MQIDLRNYQKALAVLERRDTVTARRMEIFLRRNRESILMGKTILSLSDKECQILIEDRENDN